MTRYYFDNQRVIRTTSEKGKRSDGYFAGWDSKLTQQELLDEAKAFVKAVAKVEKKRAKGRM